MGNETQMVNVLTDQARMEQVQKGFSEDLAEVKTDVKTILHTIEGFKIANAEQRGIDRTLAWGGSALLAVAMSWVSNKLNGH